VQVEHDVAERRGRQRARQPEQHPAAPPRHRRRPEDEGQQHEVGARVGEARDGLGGRDAVEVRRHDRRADGADRERADDAVEAERDREGPQPRADEQQHRGVRRGVEGQPQRVRGDGRVQRVGAGDDDQRRAGAVGQDAGADQAPRDAALLRDRRAQEARAAREGVEDERAPPADGLVRAGVEERRGAAEHVRRDQPEPEDREGHAAGMS
jgi:hypothetical protein